MKAESKRKSQHTVWIDDEIIEQLDAMAASLSRANGVEVSRNSVARRVLLAGLEAIGATGTTNTEGE